MRVYDAGEHDGDAFVVLDLIDGPTLADRLAATGPPTPTETADLGAQVADALAHVHDRGVVHRDVTPANVLCGPEGQAFLADFGIARLIDTTRLTAAETAVGTAAYMAPEQVQGLDVEPAADIYSLGLVLLELLTGRKAFTGSAPEAALARLTRSPDTDTDVPSAFRPLLRQMTDRTPSNRPTAAEVRHRLSAMVLGAEAFTAPLAALNTTTPRPLRGSEQAVTIPLAAPTADGTTVIPAALLPDEPASRRRLPLVVLLAVLGLCLAGAVVLASNDGRNPVTPTPTTEPVTATSTVATTPPTTEPPAETTAPNGGPGNGEGNGQGKGKGANAKKH